MEMKNYGKFFAVSKFRKLMHNTPYFSPLYKSIAHVVFEYVSVRKKEKVIQPPPLDFGSLRGTIF